MNINKKKKIIGFSGIAIVLLAALAFIFKNQIFADVDTSKPYNIFQAENFAQVTWDTKPTASQVINPGGTISTFAAQGQTEDISFSVRPNVDLGEVQLDLTDLKMGDKIIPKENIEVLNLKVWEQCAPKLDSAGQATRDWNNLCLNNSVAIAAPLPELLVKNNEQDLISADKGWDATANSYAAPSVDSKFQAILSSGKTHTFYLRIKTPDNTQAGNYEGSIVFKPGNSIASQSIKLGLDVLPFSLPDSKKEILAHNTYRINDSKSSYYNQAGRANIGEANYIKYLDYLRQAGFTGLIVKDYEHIGRVAELMKAKGFTKLIWEPVAYYDNQFATDTSDPYKYYKRSDFETKIKEIYDAGYKEVYVYAVDEAYNLDKIMKNIRYAQVIHQAGKKLNIPTYVVNSIPKQIYDINNAGSLNPQILEMAGNVTQEEAKIDLPIYAIGGGNSSNWDYSADFDWDRSWRISVSKDKKFFSAVFPNMKTIGSSLSKTLSTNVWHHVASVWDGSKGEQTLYLDNEPAETKSISTAIGSQLLKNSGRTIIGSDISAPRSIGTLPFKGQIARIKVYNKALSKSDIVSGSQAPAANYDFTSGTVGTTGCQSVGGVSKADGDGPETGQSSLRFTGKRYAYLDCGVNDNYGITNSMTVEAWIKIPEGTLDAENVIITKSESPARQYTRVEDYIAAIINKKTSKSNQTEYSYNQMWPEYANLADLRATSGFYLQASKLEGYAPFGLDDPVNSEGNSYYNDMDANQKSWFSLYPSASGDPLLTYQFEAFRTGVDDSRYMTLYNDLLAKLRVKNQDKATAIDKEIQDVLNKYPYNVYGDSKSFAGQPNSYHQANRKLVADKIVEMQKILGIVSLATPTPTVLPSQTATITAVQSATATAIPSATTTPTSSVSTSYTFSRGFSTFGTTGSLSTKPFTDQGLVVYKLDSVKNQWLVSSVDKFDIEPFVGYYIYNSSSAPKSLTLPFVAKRTENFVLSKGWNLLYTSIGSSKAGLRFKVSNTDDSLTNLISSYKIDSKIFIIDNYNSSNPCTYFSLLADTDQPSNCTTSSNKRVKTIPAGKAFWVYVK